LTKGEIMILDDLNNSSLYTKLHPGFQKAFEYLKSCNAATTPAGRYEIEGNSVYAIVQEYETIPENELRWEAHRKYIDIQYILSGNECMGWSNIKYISDQLPYNEVQDCIISSDTEEASFIHMNVGQFTILFPEDVHKPKCRFSEKCSVRKIVIKVAL
jgi:YhcH/YjgK/YiaL family protein